jgi:hypothetical protein
VILPALAAFVVLVASGHDSVVPRALQSDELPSFADDALAAHAGDDRVLWKDLDPVLVSRRVLSKDGRESLKHLAQSMILERLAKERGIQVSDAVVAKREKDLDDQVKASGDASGIGGLMRKARLTPEEFRRFLRLSFVEETLTRRALGLDDKAEVKGDQQELWMEEAMRDRGYTEFGPPWKDGVVAKCSDFSITMPELLAYLRKRLPPPDLREDCYQLILLRRLRAKMSDVAPDKIEKAVDEEIARRRAEAAADPRNKGVAWDRLMVAEGYVLDTIRDDSAIRIAALARVWVDRSLGPDGLKKAYEADRAHFDGLYGAAIDTTMLYLRAAQFKNELNPRSFQEAESELEKLSKDIHAFADFQRLAHERSEEAPLRANGGALGFVSGGTDRARLPDGTVFLMPHEIRDELARALAAPAAGGTGVDPARSMSEPIRLPTGVALLWLGERRPPPTWDTMAAQVHREMRRKLVDDTLAKNAVVTAFEVP